MLWCCLAAAQESETPVGQPPGATAAGAATGGSAVEESKIPIFLRSKDGRLVAMPGWTFEEFEALYQESRGLKTPDQTPRYSLQSMSISGIAKASFADLTVEVGLLIRDEGPALVPLAMNQGLLRGQVQYDGPVKPVIHFAKEAEGYFALIEGRPSQQHQLTFNLLVPIARAGGETRAVLSLPRAVNSNLKLKVPLDEATARVSGGAIILATSAVDGGGTEFEVQGPGGDFELAWRKATSRDIRVQPVLEAVGDLLCTINDRVLNTEATLIVQSYGSPFDSFRVSLPSGAELVSSNTSDYSLVPVESRGGRKLVEVRLAEKKQEQTVSLFTERSIQDIGPTEWIELAGFEVTEAARQQGEISVAVVGDLYVFWGTRRGVEQVELSAQTAWDADLVAGFKYHSQPFRLAARVAPRTTRLSVEPEYLLLIGPDRVDLEATLRYTVRGAKLSSLDLDLAGWEVDDAGPYDGLVALGGVAVDPSGPVSIALSQPMIDEFEITVRAHKEIAPGTSSLELSLPKPQADSLMPAAVAVLAADNVELTVNTEATLGLVKQQVTLPIELPKRYQPPLFYRQEAAEAVFATGMSVHGQSIEVDVTSEVDLLPEQGLVVERLDYSINYQPVSELMLVVPDDLLLGGSLEVFHGDVELKLEDPLDPPHADDPTGTVRRRVVLPEGQIGRYELTVRFPVGIERLQPETSVPCTVPLVMPAGGVLKSNVLYVTATPGVQVHLREGPWEVSTERIDPPRKHNAAQFAATERTYEADLGVSTENGGELGSTVVNRAFIQTHFGPKLRHDQAFFQFQSDQRSIELILPGGVDMQQVRLRLDGVDVQAALTRQGNLLVPLQTFSADRPSVLDVEYLIVGEKAGPGQMSIELPRLGRGVVVNRMYWLLMLPQNEHLVRMPDGLAGEFVWGWTGSFWGRVPLLDRRELDEWVGTPQSEPSSNSMSRYLFSSLGAVDKCQIRTASRSLIVLTASGIALVAGLLLIYVPASRHPVTLLAVSIMLLAAAVLFPEPTLLVLQAASLGLALILMAGLLRRSVAQRRRGMLGETASSILERGSTKTLHPLPPVGNRDTTKTQPPPSPMPASDSHS